MKAMAMEWLEHRLKWFIVEMADFVIETDEEAMRARCEAELEVWRAYSEETTSLSFQEMVMQTRIALRTSIPAPQNEWWNPETEEWEHIGLKYLKCTEAEWEQMRQDWLDRRLLLPDPDQIVSRAIGLLCTGMMDATAWPQLVVAIAVLTGQGLRCILKDGCFSQKTAFSLLCRDTAQHSPLFAKPFELPTLGRADLVVEAWERVRELVDCEQMEKGELWQRYGHSVQEVASTYFGDLVPVRNEDLFTQLHNSVYPCLATHYYCPPSVETVDSLARSCNDPLLLADPSSGEHWACAAVGGYLEYRLADERKGIWLERVREMEQCAHHACVEVEFEAEEIAGLDEIRQQMGFDQASSWIAAREEDPGGAGAQRASGTLKLSLSLWNQGLSPVLYEFLHLGFKHLRDSLAEFVSVCLKEDMLEGLKLQRPFPTMLTSELRGCTHCQATYELARRALLTVMRYNQSCSQADQRWYVDEEVVFHLIQPQWSGGGLSRDDQKGELEHHHQRYLIERCRSDIRWCLDDYREELDCHHQLYHLRAEGNRKAFVVTEVIALSEEPGLFEQEVWGC